MKEGSVIGVVLVNYKSLNETVDYVLQQLIPDLPKPYRLVVVNNAATDELDEALCSGLDAELVEGNTLGDPSKQHFVISCSKNLGFAKGNNLGAQFLIDHFDVHWLVFTNNDLILAAKSEVVAGLIEKCKADSRIGVIGPKIVGPDGVDQSPSRKMSIWSLIIPRLFYPLIFPWVRAGYFREVVMNADEGFYYRIMGSFFLMPKAAFVDCGGFDPNTFLYAEEQILSERLMQIGREAYYLSSKCVIHDHGSVTSKFHSRRQRAWMNLSSLRYYFRTYRGTKRWEERLAVLSFYVLFFVYDPFLSILRYFASKPNMRRSHPTTSRPVVAIQPEQRQ